MLEKTILIIIKLIAKKIIKEISENSLNKILVLGIKDKNFFFSDVLKSVHFIFGLQDQCFD